MSPRDRLGEASFSPWGTLDHSLPGRGRCILGSVRGVSSSIPGSFPLKARSTPVLTTTGVPTRPSVSWGRTVPGEDLPPPPVNATK